jgi:hypothetical protein
MTMLAEVAIATCSLREATRGLRDHPLCRPLVGM